MEWTFVVIMAVFTSAALIECLFGFAAVRSALENREKRLFIIIPVSDHMEDAEYILLKAADMMERSDIPCKGIIMVIGEDEDIMKMCSLFADDHGGFEIRRVS